MRLPDQLPSITGRRGAAVRAVFWLMVAATAIGFAGSLWFNARDRFTVMPTTVGYGFRTYLTDAGTIVGERAPRAIAAGLRDGDLIVAVGAARLSPAPREIEVAHALQAAPAATTLTVRRPEGEARLPIRRAADPWLQPDPESGVALWLVVLLGFAALEVSPLILLATAALLARRRPHDAEALLFAAACLGLCWTANVMQWLSALAGVPLDLFTLSINLAWCGLFVAVAGFPNGRFESLPARLAAVAGVALAVLNLPLRWWPELGVRFDGLWIAAAAVVLGGAALALLLRYRRAAVASTARQQIKWVLLGFGAAGLLKLGALVLQRIVGLQTGAPNFVIEALAVPLTYAAIALGLLVALLRFRLYDAEAAISRSASYAVLTVALVAVFTGTEKVVELLGQDYLGNGAGALVGGVGAAVMIAPLHTRAAAWAERRFRAHLVELRCGLPALVDDLRETADRGELARAVVARVERDVRARGVGLVVGGAAIAATGRDWDDGSALRVPLAADSVPEQGVLLVGPRPDGSAFGREERAALADVAGPVARALAVIARRDAERTALLARIDRLEALVARPTRRRG